MRFFGGKGGDRELDALRTRLRRLSPSLRRYGAWKVRLDPVYALAVPMLEGRRELVDLGAGIGLLAALLHERSPSTRCRSVEWDAAKAAAAVLLLEGIERATVSTEDARVVDLGAPDAITLFDVLHYLPIRDQSAWLERCAGALEPGGVLLVRELDARPSRLAERLERVAVMGGWNRGRGVHVWSIPDMCRHLERSGLRVKVLPAGRGLFRGNALLVARKPAPPS